MQVKAIFFKTCIFSCLFLSKLSGLNAQTGLGDKSTVKVSIDDILAFRKEAKIQSSNQTISNKNDALKFLRYVIDNSLTKQDDLYNDISTFVEKLEKKEAEDRGAIVLLQHPHNLDKLLNRMSTINSKISANYSDTCGKNKKYKTILSSIEMKIEAFENEALTDEQTKKVGELVSIRESLLKQIQFFEERLEKMTKEYKMNVNEIQEDTSKLEKFVLTREGIAWTDYLLNKKKMLLVLVGGKDDLMKANIKIENKPSSFETSLNELYQLAGVMIDLNTQADPSACAIQVDRNDSIPITFIVINEDKIKTPSELLVNLPNTKNNLTFNIHEKMRFGIKVGFSAAYVDRKNFSVDSSNALTVKLDSLQKAEIKSNLMVLFEFVPWGRDIDRLEPVWAKNKVIKTFDIQRFGFAFGVKMSKDPLQAIYSGISYSMSREVALNFGVGFYSTPKNIDKLPVGVNASLDYLKDNADRKLEPKLFFGISFSPKMLGKTIGVLK